MSKKKNDLNKTKPFLPHLYPQTLSWNQEREWKGQTLSINSWYHHCR